MNEDGLGTPGAGAAHVERLKDSAPDQSPTAKKMNQLSAMVATALRPDTEDAPIHAASFGYEARQLVEKAFRDMLNGRPGHCSISFLPESWDELGARFTPEALSLWAKKIYDNKKPDQRMSADERTSIDQLAQQVNDIVQSFVREQNLALMLGRVRAA